MLLSTLLLLTSLGSVSALAADTVVCPNPLDELIGEGDLSPGDLPAIAAKLEGYKADDAVDRYLKCWMQDDRYKLYVEKYRPRVKAAAEAAGIPFSILACLFFRESGWNASIKSPSGAVGLAQLLPGTWQSMVDKLSGPPPRVTNRYAPDNLRKKVPRDGGKRDLQIKAVEDFYKTNYKNGAITGKANLAKLQSLYLALSTTTDAGLGALVKQYLTNVETALTKQKIQEVYAEYKTKIGRSPNLANAEDPDSAIIIGAAYLKTTVYPGIFKYTGTASNAPSHDRWIIAVGGYNTGPAASPCKGWTSADECIAEVYAAETRRARAKNPKIKDADIPRENSRHMKAVRNCSEHENRDPMPGSGEKKCVI